MEPDMPINQNDVPAATTRTTTTYAIPPAEHG